MMKKSVCLDFSLDFKRVKDEEEEEIEELEVNEEEEVELRRERERSVDLQEQLRQSEREVVRLKEVTLVRLRRELEQEKTQRVQLHQQLELVRKESKVQQLKWTKQKKELHSQLSRLAHLDLKYKAVLNKKEQEYERLRLHLKQPKPKVNSTNSTVLNSTSSAAQLLQSQQDQLDQQLIQSYQMQQQTLSQENQSLRSQLQQLTTALKLLQSQYKTTFTFHQHKNNWTTSQPQDLPLDFNLHLPIQSQAGINSTDDNIFTRIKQSMDMLQQRLEQLDSQIKQADSSEQMEDRIELLQGVIQTLVAITHEQDGLLQQSLLTQPDSPTPPPTTVDLQELYAEKLETLEANEKEFQRKLANFEQERELFTKEALALDKDKLRLHHESIHRRPQTTKTTSKENDSTIFEDDFCSTFTPVKGKQKKINIHFPPTPVTSNLLAKIGGVYEPEHACEFLLSPIKNRAGQADLPKKHL